ncbi:tetratricopeptide repeat protein [Aporhodopirellula aestuarii]|uniref:Tetratricopeptide repeat protein n=1 Tax=Aporhodopirellula aestuarii TaxID=2950107 RepID=A0ABT0U067_9BACT|nr:hypothetical protein [Aporhodopirellula aestuarii]MCM2370136.1 hypothetical protein [Aporhodopirellula aestuarii]
MSDQPELDIDEQLKELDAKETEFTRLCLLESANRVASEIRRLAKAERRFVPYLQATFTLMNNAADRLDPQSGRDASIEIIGLLESNELARAIQPNLSEHEYDWAVHWYSACGYDNLAKATAELGGHNSEGIHACISEGIEVCRRTGKTQCITCFREYATDVYRSADDPDMALHYARMGIAAVDQGPHDRRWAGARDLVEILLARGELAAAAENVDAVIEFADIWHTPIRARLITKTRITEIAHLIGEPQRWADQCCEDAPPAGEFLAYELHTDHTQATIECMAGDFEPAIKRLTHWDQFLTRRQCFVQWTLTRLRLLAAHRMAGNQRVFEKLADHLQKKAQAARDWHALRCLKHLRDESATTVPVPVTCNLDAGPLAGTTQTEVPAASVAPVASVEMPSEVEAAAAKDKQEGRELPDAIAAIHSRLAALSEEEWENGGDSDSLDQIISDLLAIDPSNVGSDEEQQTFRHWALHTISFLLRDAERATEIWDWAGRCLAAQRQDAVTLSLYARLGCRLRYNCAEQMSDRIDESQLESWFRESLDLDPEKASNFGRAGDFFLFLENLGEAERCYARGFRLDRSHAELASKLARVYRRTERERDALAVLDMAIRAGADEPDLFWEAALSAQNLDQHEATLTYLDGFEKRTPNQAWVNYYRTVALLELQRFPEALAAAERESELNPECPFPVLVHRAAVAAGTGELDELRRLLGEVLAIPLASIDYLSISGIEKVLVRLWASTEALGEDDELRTQVSNRLLASSLAPDRLFEVQREKREPVEQVNFYRCVIKQPLDERWLTWPGRLAGEEELQCYQATWGVLARSDEEAAELASQWQSHCYPLDGEVVGVELVGEGYTERTGVVWQRFREAAN